MWLGGAAVALRSMIECFLLRECGDFWLYAINILVLVFLLFYFGIIFADKRRRWHAIFFPVLVSSHIIFFNEMSEFEIFIYFIKNEEKKIYYFFLFVGNGDGFNSKKLQLLSIAHTNTHTNADASAFLHCFVHILHINKLLLLTSHEEWQRRWFEQKQKH